MEIIIHGTGAMGRLLKEMAEGYEDIKVTGFTDELTDEAGDIIIEFFSLFKAGHSFRLFKE